MKTIFDRVAKARAVIEERNAAGRYTLNHRLLTISDDALLTMLVTGEVADQLERLNDNLELFKGIESGELELEASSYSVEGDIDNNSPAVVFRERLDVLEAAKKHGFIERGAFDRFKATIEKRYQRDIAQVSEGNSNGES